MQNCPDITILVSHDVSNGAGHGGVGHRIYHGVDHEVGHGVSHEVSQGRGVTSSQSADQMSRESQVLKVTFCVKTGALTQKVTKIFSQKALVFVIYYEIYFTTTIVFRCKRRWCTSLVR